MFGRAKPGNIYLLRALDRDQLYASRGWTERGCSYKIGKSKDAITRHATIGVKFPYPVELICVFSVDDMHRTEQFFHSFLSHCQLRGEWFDLHESHVAWFLKLCWESEEGNWRGVIDIPSQHFAEDILGDFNDQLFEGISPLCEDAENHRRGLYFIL